jgi:hypothetical protein
MFRLLFVLVLPIVIAISPPMPAFMWSGNNNFLKTSNHEVAEPLSVSVLADLVKYASGQSESAPVEISSYVATQHQTPELIVVFVHPELQTSQVSSYGDAFTRKSNGGSFFHLKNYLEQSPSSLTIPYLFKTVGAQQNFIEDLKQLNHVHQVDAEDAPAFIHGHHSLFTDSKPDIIVVKFNPSSDDVSASLKQSDSIMGQIVERVRKQSHGNYLAIVTSNNPTSTKSKKSLDSLTQTIFAQSKSSMKQDESSDDSGSSTSTSNYSSDDALYISPAILSSLIVVFFLVSVTFVGVGALMALKTPDSWENDGGFLAGN